MHMIIQSQASLMKEKKNEGISGLNILQPQIAHNTVVEGEKIRLTSD